jgi:hypothetical protein
MKLKNVLILFLAVSATINVSAQKKQSSGPNVAEKNASNVIEYTNSIIDIVNAFNGIYNDFDGMLFMADSEIRSIKSKSSKLAVTGFGKDTSNINSKFYLAYEASFKNIPATFENKEKVIASVQTAQAGVQNLFKSTRALNRYFTEKEYEKDSKDYPIYDVLKDSVIANVANLKNLWRIAAKEASKAGSEAENVLLKRSPMAEFIIPMKTDLNTMKELLEEAFSEDENLDWNAIKAQSAKLKAAFEKVKNGEGKNMNKLGNAKQSEFTGFYNSGITLMEKIDNLAEVTSKIPAVDNDQLERAYSNVDRQYNDLIKCYNYFATEQY